MIFFTVSLLLTPVTLQGIITCPHLSLSSVEATDLTTFPLTNNCRSVIDVNYPFCSVTVINSNETELRTVSVLLLKYVAPEEEFIFLRTFMGC